ncbi:hypothetical protein [Mongoliitalea daihaiensis]|uniref:hypothetical protein n=1 Tax=Mongoliitalea daihaiensis TaxID=2782006 RepID=UPI001F27393B|nr:hypothetical protein [Mongoliitalea daihaiensis]UJP65543.1 hypothetical protein IPZ59_02635 [Mongoliitalea daihaiensis]
MEISRVKKELGYDFEPSPELKQSMAKLSEAFRKFESNNEAIFKKTLKTVKHILKQKSLILPRDWKEVFYEWYLSKELTKEERSELDFKTIPELIKDPKIILKWAKEYSEKIDEELFTPPEKVEAYKNLPHALCILDDLGILDFIEEKFTNKNYSGKARETDKAKLIATILNIDDGEKVRLALKNKDYLSKTAKKNTKKILNNLGLTSSFDDD